MALIKCTECGKEFSDKASACPNCGCETKYLNIEKQRQLMPFITADTFDSFVEYEWNNFNEYSEEFGVLAKKQHDENQQLEAEYEEIINNLKLKIRSIPEEIKELQNQRNDLGFFAGSKKREIDQRILKLKTEEEKLQKEVNKKEEDKQPYNKDSEYRIKLTALREKHKNEKLSLLKKACYFYNQSSASYFKLKVYSTESKSDFVENIKKLCVERGIEKYVNEFGPVDIEYFSLLSGFDKDLVSESFSNLVGDSFISCNPEYFHYNYHIERKNGNALLYADKPQKTVTKKITPANINEAIENLRGTPAYEKYLERMAAIDAHYGAELAAIRAMGKEKDASVIGRAVAGTVIAGPAGAVVGALSAVDKNIKNKK